MDSSIKEFMRLNPLTFEGGLDSVIAGNWVQPIEEILEVLGYTNKKEKIEEFTNLTQGNMTIGEYAAKFVELSHFVLFLILNEVRKAKKFDKCLRRRIYELVVGFQVQNFLNLVDKLSVLKKSIQSSTKPTEQKKRLAPSTFQAMVSRGSGKKGKDSVLSSYQDSQSYLICQTCNKKHMGECWFRTPICFRMDPKDKDVEAEERDDLETSNEEEIDTSMMLMGIS
ncbi:uncharacterized protein LOC131163428 [Malania oleifera]|uniref:uncharacterized protein LOC131163428 n=1 Tax=Malania oleifera TaxID=397392 RepID=UPI0025AE4ADC|nr:uncharacterized protein LOC131163428 [Malania oleifera]